MNLLGLFGLVAIAELVVFVAVERQIGLPMALLIALVTAVLGSVFVRSAGLAVLGRFREKLGVGQLPGRELTHGAAVLVSGALLISPGFLTDAIGFALLVPAVRDGLHGFIMKRFGDRIHVVDAQGAPSDMVIDVDSWEEQ